MKTQENSDKAIKPIVNQESTADDPRFWLAAIVESSDDAIVSKDLNGIISSWNAAAERIFGYEAGEIVGQSVLKLIPPELQYEEPEILRKLRSGERIDHYETERLHKDGHRVQVSLTISPIRDASGRVIGASKTARDITLLKRAQNALTQAEKLTAMGQFAATMAHEINNPLEILMNLGYLLQKDPSLGADARQYVSMLVSELSRVADIARQALASYQESSSKADTRDTA